MVQEAILCCCSGKLKDANRRHNGEVKVKHPIMAIILKRKSFG